MKIHFILDTGSPGIVKKETTEFPDGLNRR